EIRPPLWRRLATAATLAVASVLGACSGGSLFPGDFFGGAPQPSQPAPGTQIGSGQVKVGLLLPLSAAGNAGVVAQSMRNAAEMALAEFQNPNIQLLVKDDGGTQAGAQSAAQAALA